MSPTYSAQDLSRYSAYERNLMYRMQQLGEVPFPVSGDATADDAAWGM